MTFLLYSIPDSVVTPWLKAKLQGKMWPTPEAVVENTALE